MDSHHPRSKPSGVAIEGQPQFGRRQGNFENVPSVPATIPRFVISTNAGGVLGSVSTSPLGNNSFDSHNISQQSLLRGVPHGSGTQQTHASVVMGVPVPQPVMLVYMADGQGVFPVWMPVSAVSGNWTGRVQTGLDRSSTQTARNQFRRDITGKQQEYRNKSSALAPQKQASGDKSGKPMRNISGCSTQAAHKQVTADFASRQQRETGRGLPQAAGKQASEDIAGKPKSGTNWSAIRATFEQALGDIASGPHGHMERGFAQANGKRTSGDIVGAAQRNINVGSAQAADILVSGDIDDTATRKVDKSFAQATPKPADKQAPDDITGSLQGSQNRRSTPAAHTPGGTRAAARQGKRPPPNTIAVGLHKRSRNNPGATYPKDGGPYHRGRGRSEETISGIRSVYLVRNNTGSISPPLASISSRSTQKSDIAILRETRFPVSATCPQKSPASISDSSLSFKLLESLDKNDHQLETMYPLHHTRQPLSGDSKPLSVNESSIRHTPVHTKSICSGSIVHSDDFGKPSASAEAVAPCLVKGINSIKRAYTPQSATSITPNQPLLDKQVCVIEQRITRDAKLCGHQTVTSIASVKTHEKVGTGLEIGGLTPMSSRTVENNRAPDRASHSPRGLQSKICRKASSPTIVLKRLKIKHSEVNAPISIGSISRSDVHLYDHNYSVLSPTMDSVSESEEPMKESDAVDEDANVVSGKSNSGCSGIRNLDGPTNSSKLNSGSADIRNNVEGLKSDQPKSDRDGISKDDDGSDSDRPNPDIGAIVSLKSSGSDQMDSGRKLMYSGMICSSRDPISFDRHGLNDNVRSQGADHIDGKGSCVVNSESDGMEDFLDDSRLDQSNPVSIDINHNRTRSKLNQSSFAARKTRNVFTDPRLDHTDYNNDRSSNESRTDNRESALENMDNDKMSSRQEARRGDVEGLIRNDRPNVCEGRRLVPEEITPEYTTSYEPEEDRIDGKNPVSEVKLTDIPADLSLLTGKDRLRILRERMRRHENEIEELVRISNK